MTTLSIAALLLAAAPAAMGRPVPPVGMSFPTDKIVGDQVLLRGQELTSLNNLCKMAFKGEGNIVRYYRADENDNWVLDTRNGPGGWDISDAEQLHFSTFGNLYAVSLDIHYFRGEIIRGSTLNAISAGTNGHVQDSVPAGAIFKAVLGGDCNLVIYVNDDVVWTWNKGDLPSRAADDLCRSDGTWCRGSASSMTPSCATSYRSCMHRRYILSLPLSFISAPHPSLLNLFLKNSLE